MQLLKKLVTTAAMFAVAGALANTAIAEGLDEIDPAIVERLYNADMLDPAQPIGISK